MLTWYIVGLIYLAIGFCFGIAYVERDINSNTVIVDFLLAWLLWGMHFVVRLFAKFIKWTDF
jgi:hypothetical protein